MTRSAARFLALLCCGAASLHPAPAVARPELPSAAGVAADPAARLPDHPWEPRHLAVPWGEGRVRMAYVDAGPPAAPPILLLHGQPTWSYLWRHQIRDLVARGHRVISPDLIGYGRSDKPADPASYTHAAHVAAIAAFVRALDLSDVTLVVHDWGGLIGLNVAARMPERLACLVLLDTSLNDGRDPEPPGFAQGFARWLRFLQTAPIVDAGAIVEAQTACTLRPEERAAYMAPYPDPALQAGLRRMSALIPRTPGDPHAAENAAARAELAGWPKPVMILFSKGSERTHPGQFDRFRALFPSGSIRLAARVPGGRHFVMEDAPDTVSALIDAFVACRPLEPPVSGAAPARTGAEGAMADVEAYAGFGAQRTGSPGSASTLAWLERRLSDAGYRLRRLTLPVDGVRIGAVGLTVSGTLVEGGVPLWPVVPTGPGGLRAPLAEAGAARPGDIAVVRLQHDPRASVDVPGHRARLEAAAARQPAAIVVVTEHPTGEAVALNVNEERPFRPGLPMIVVGSRHAGMLASGAAGRVPATLVLDAEVQPGSDSTLLAERGPPGAPALVISTPRNGWFAAGGERGSGIALALALASRLPERRPDRRLVLVFTSHHELGAHGMRAALRDPALAPGRVASWLHIGANAAVREVGWAADGPHLGAEPSRARGLAISPAAMPAARAAFDDLPGFDLVPLGSDRVVGEVGLIRAGRSHVIAGLVGWQLLHHTALDDARTTTPAILADTLERLMRLLDQLP